MSQLTLDVVGIGNAIVDIIASADDAFLETHAMSKGGMMLVDEQRAEAIYALMGPTMISSGGSAGNTIAGIASLGGRTGYIGKVRDDEFGHAFRHDITAPERSSARRRRRRDRRPRSALFWLRRIRSAR